MAHCLLTVENDSHSQKVESLEYQTPDLLLKSSRCVFFVFQGRQPSGNHEEALPGRVAGLCVQAAGDPREKEV